MAHRYLGMVAALPLLVGACDASQRGLDGWDEARLVGNTLAFARTGEDQVALLDLSDKEPEPVVQRVALDLPVRRVVARGGDHEELLVLGIEARDPEEAQAELTLIDAEGAVRQEAVDPALSDLQVSADGRYAVRYGLVRTDAFLTSRSQVEVVDLDGVGTAAGNAQKRVLASLGGEPAAVTFLPELSFDGQALRLLLVQSVDAISLVDLDHAERSEVSVELPEWAWTVGGGESARVVIDATGQRIYLFRAGRSELLAIDLVGREAATDENPFRPVLSTLTVPAALVDVAPYRLNGEARLACATGSGVAVVDPLRGTASLLAAGDRIRALQVYDEAGEMNGPYALLAMDRSVGIADLYGLEPGGVQLPVRTVVSGQNVSSVVLYEEDGVALANLGESGIAVVDLARKTAVPFASSAPISSQLLDRGRGGVWLNSGSDERIAFFEFQQQTVSEVRLDAPVVGFLPLPAMNRVVALHADSAGHITLLDADDPTRGSAFALHGFLVEGFGD